MLNKLSCPPLSSQQALLLLESNPTQLYFTGELRIPSSGILNIHKHISFLFYLSWLLFGPRLSACDMTPSGQQAIELQQVRSKNFIMPIISPP